MEVIPGLTIYLSHRDLPMLLKATIEPMFLSDHHPITMLIEFQITQSRSQIWRLVPSLLTDNKIASHIQLRLSQFFNENDSAEISPMIIWEAHKCTIRGELMAIASKRRREKTKIIIQSSCTYS